MAKQKTIPDPILMVLSIFLVTGFQFYWLKNNYNREKKNLEVSAGVDFQETVTKLQASKLKLNISFKDSAKQHDIKVIIKDSDFVGHSPNLHEKKFNARAIVTMVDAIRDKSEHDSVFKTTTIVAPGKDKHFFYADSVLNSGGLGSWKIPDKVIQLLSGVDSLQDSLKIPEITKAYIDKLKEDKIVVPFTISKIDSMVTDEGYPDFANVVVGFSHPKTYQLKLGNTFPFLIKKISTPIIFSVFLVGLTIISFIVLYRNLAKQRRLTEIKNEFISNITHELKTPIATVSVAIEALRNFDAVHDPEKTKEYLDISASELQRLGLLVDKVLKLSMLENRHIELKKENFDLHDLINEVIQIMKVQFEKQHAHVIVETKGKNFPVEADRLHMTSVLYNLLDNALKYGSKDPVITIQLASPKENILELKISDNGPGIPKEYQSKIFEKFFRVPTGNQHDTKGHGLGLSYVKEIIMNHMGYITVNSDKESGTTFTILIPMKAAPVVDFGDGRKIIRKVIRIG
ncbi:MAG: HAMP domain-containing histidine kinase [Bacteroidetes bacterium]|nr:HAMP domain-containing histidine kinase [Bacteroidota bacterium]